MATKTFEELKQLAIQIRDEKTNKQNTATRIGTQMLEHLDKLEQDYYDKTATDEELKERDEKLTELENKTFKIFPKGNCYITKNYNIHYYNSFKTSASSQGIAIFKLKNDVNFKITNIWYDANLTYKIFYLNSDRIIIGHSDNADIINSNVEINSNDLINDAPEGSEFFALVVAGNSILYSNVDLRDNTDIVFADKIKEFFADKKYLRPLSITPGYFFTNSGNLSYYDKIATTELLLVPKKSPLYLEGIYMDGKSCIIGFFDKNFNILSTTLSEAGFSKTINPEDDFIPDNAYYLCAFARYGQGSNLDIYDKPFAYSYENVFTGLSYSQVEKKFSILAKKGYFISKAGKFSEYNADSYSDGAVGICAFRLFKNVNFKISNIFFDSSNSANVAFLDKDRNIVGFTTDNVIKSNTLINTNELIAIAPETAKYFAVSLAGTDSTLYSNVDLRDNTDIVPMKVTGDRLEYNLKYFQLHTYKGYFITKNGGFSSYISDLTTNAQGITPLLRLYPDTVFSLSNYWKNDNIAARIAFFDKDCYLLGVNNDIAISIDLLNLNTDDLISIAPEGSVYFAFNIKGEYCTLICDKDLSVYYDFISKNQENHNSKVGNVLNHAKWYCGGDSYSEGDYTNSPNPESTKFTDGIYAGKNKVYSRFIALRNNMDLHLLAKCGATCGAWKEDVEAGTVDTPTHTNTFYYNQLPQILSNEDKTFNGYITLWFCINDGGHCTLGTIDDETVNTFYGALNWSAIQLITNFPLAKIGFIVSNNANSSYQQAVREVAQKWAIPYLDMEGDPQIPTISGNRKNQSIPVDPRVKTLRWDNNFRVASNNGHPNEKAHEYQSTFIENWLRSL